MIIIKKGDITKENVDVIVNAANTRLAGGGGVDGAIHRAAGPSVMEECKKIASCKAGNAVITGSGRLLCRNIIHAVGPVWHGGKKGEAEILKNAYLNSFILAKNNNLSTIALPAISTGVYGYPVKEAARIALAAGKSFDNDFKEIRYICFSDEHLAVYKKTWPGI
jgi:O-acetyl-ADP-ribose deacetylase (regulator of RNase III)